MSPALYCFADILLLPFSFFLSHLYLSCFVPCLCSSLFPLTVLSSFLTILVFAFILIVYYVSRAPFNDFLLLITYFLLISYLLCFSYFVFLITHLMLRYILSLLSYLFSLFSSCSRLIISASCLFDSFLFILASCCFPRTHVLFPPFFAYPIIYLFFSYASFLSCFFLSFQLFFVACFSCSRSSLFVRSFPYSFLSFSLSLPFVFILFLTYSCAISFTTFYYFPFSISFPFSLSFFLFLSHYI